MKPLHAITSIQPIKHSLVLCLALYIFVAYLPLILSAGISVDDWGDIAHNLECLSFWNCYRTWFPLFSNRPLAPLPITALTFALGTWYSGYLIVNSALYLAAIGISAHVMRTIIGCQRAITFVLFAAIPIIAMPVITSPINQSTATVSFLLWALSWHFLLRYLQSQRFPFWLLTFGLLLLAFLTYEVILPLLILTALLPWICDPERYAVIKPTYWLHFFIPIFLVLLIVTLWQKGIAPNFMDVDSRLKFIPSQAISKLHTFFQVFYKQVPALFLKIPSHLQWTDVLAAILAITSMAIAYSSGSKESIPTNISRRFLIASTLCFFSSSSIFILSGESAISGGYQARGLSSTWVAFAFFVATVQFRPLIFNKVWQILLLLLLGLCAMSFSIQVHRTGAAWKTQMAIVSDANMLIQKNMVTDGATILGDVPHYLPNQYNQEIVFSQPWDFGAALAITNPIKILQGPVIDSSRQEWRYLNIKEGVVTAENFAGSDLSNFWIYQFNSEQGRGTLTRITAPEQLTTWLNQQKR